MISENPVLRGTGHHLWNGKVGPEILSLPLLVYSSLRTINCLPARLAVLWGQTASFLLHLPRSSTVPVLQWLPGACWWNEWVNVGNQFCAFLLDPVPLSPPSTFTLLCLLHPAISGISTAVPFLFRKSQNLHCLTPPCLISP